MLVLSGRGTNDMGLLRDLKEHLKSPDRLYPFVAEHGT